MNWVNHDLDMAIWAAVALVLGIAALVVVALCAPFEEPEE